uniref:Uncharacterized protein n=1 Tax=Anopheles epiroticus TaxID=199890 RepID=A0A182PTJ5_9DIPT
MFQWCIAVPKQYSRIFHQQVIWPFAMNLWILLACFVIFFAFYQTMLQDILVQRYPSIYSVIHIPLQILKIMLLFLLSEYYTAMLTSNLGLSMLPTYPRTLSEFLRFVMPIIYSNNTFDLNLILQPELMSKAMKWQPYQKYEPSEYAVLVLCNRFHRSIAEITEKFGKQASHHQFHLINDPVRTLVTISPFRKSSSRLHTFNYYASLLTEAGIWEYLVQKWDRQAKLHNNQSTVGTIGLVNFNAPEVDFIPEQLEKHVSTAAFLNIDFNRHYRASTPYYIPILLHAFADNTTLSSMYTNMEHILDTLDLLDKEKKVIVIVNSDVISSNDVFNIANTYVILGVINIIYVLVTSKIVYVVGFNSMYTEIIRYTLLDSAQTLFPNRGRNLSMRPYYVVCYEDPTFTFKNRDNKTVGSTIDFVDIIAKHQSTSVQYIYTSTPETVFLPGKITPIDFATYRLIGIGERRSYTVMQLPVMFKLCIAVPKQYTRIFHQQVIWPFSMNLWILLACFVIFFAFYQTILQDILAQRYPSIYSVIHIPLQILKIMLLFLLLLSEYYTAMLTSNLGLSMLPTYPRTLSEFLRSDMPIIYSNETFVANIILPPNLLSKAVALQPSQSYKPSEYAVLVLCDRFRYGIAYVTKRFGNQASYHQFHLINDPVRTLVTISPFRKTSSRLHSFKHYASMLTEAGIWEYLVQKWDRII